jgi:hypothetical protein
VTVAFEWPAVLTTALATAYTGRSKWTLARDARAGKLEAAGRCGRSLTFRREALDAYLIGPGVTPQPAAAPVLVKREAPRPAAPHDLAIARLRRLAKGGA